MTGELINNLAFFRHTECEYYWDFSLTYCLNIIFITIEIEEEGQIEVNYKNMSP